MKIILFIAVIIAFFVSHRLSMSAIRRYGNNRHVSVYRITYISKTISFGLIALYAIILINISGFEYTQISTFLASVFAVIGMAFFAQWSILSNISASLIIFFGFPYRVGDHIKVVDKDDDIQGIIEEITLFHVLIRRGNELITYPNTLILQKGVIKNPGLDMPKSPGTELSEKEQKKE